MNKKETVKPVNKLVNSLIKRLSVLGKFVKAYKKLKEANQICVHFSTYLSSIVADTPDLEKEVYRIRHNVYCEELAFEPPRKNGLETDEFDEYSHYCLIHHKRSGKYAGTVRLVTPQQEGELLPLEKYCLGSITNKELDPRKFPRHQVCEISRLAVPKAFRRRQMDNFSGAATGGINTKTYSDSELRCFPFIAVGLYFTAAALAMNKEIQHAYVMMEPRLARSMRFIGIKFDQIGPVIDYHGKRAPYYINQPMLLRNLSRGFRIMLMHIRRNVNEQIQNK